MAFVPENERIPTDNPEPIFTQEELPEIPDLQNPIVPVIGGAILQTGDFTSPNYRKGQAGWKIDSRGNAEFQNITVNKQKGNFGGDGSDGDLVIGSGTTTINLGGADIVTKNYNSISITGTGSLTFSNPHAGGTLIFLKSKGNITITSSATRPIDARGMGATGTTLPNFFIGTALVYGNGTTAGVIWDSLTKYTTYQSDSYNFIARVLAIAPGAAGSDGSAAQLGGEAGGAGGRGGGALYIECAGTWSFTVANGIDVSGSDGATGTAGSNTLNHGGAGGGGGGNAGQCIVLYNTLGANSGSIKAAGGAGGTGGNTANGSWGQGVGCAAGGGGAGSMEAAGGAGSPGNGGAGTPAAGSNAAGAGSGGGGGAGLGWDNGAGHTNGPSAGGTGGTSSSKHYKIALNTYFV